MEEGKEDKRGDQGDGCEGQCGPEPPLSAEGSRDVYRSGGGPGRTEGAAEAPAPPLRDAARRPVRGEADGFPSGTAGGAGDGALRASRPDLLGSEEVNAPLPPCCPGRAGDGVFPAGGSDALLGSAHLLYSAWADALPGGADPFGEPLDPAVDEPPGRTALPAVQSDTAAGSFSNAGRGHDGGLRNGFPVSHPAGGAGTVGVELVVYPADRVDDRGGQRPRGRESGG